MVFLHLQLHRGLTSDSFQRYCKEVIICKQVKHPNIFSIEGVAPALHPFCIVSQWMENGNMKQYIVKYGGVDRLKLVSLMH